jgi:hypothetical protein
MAFMKDIFSPKQYIIGIFKRFLLRKSLSAIIVYCCGIDANSADIVSRFSAIQYRYSG